MIADRQKTPERIRTGAEPDPEQQMAARRRSSRRRRMRAQVRIRTRVHDYPAGGHDTAPAAISACMDPRQPMP